MHYALIRPDPDEVVKELLERGADVSVCTDDGATVLHYAIQRSWPSEDLVKQLLERGVDCHGKDKSALYYGATTSSETVLGWLLKSRLDIKTKDRQGWTALHHAVLAARENILALARAEKLFAEQLGRKSELPELENIENASELELCMLKCSLHPENSDFQSDKGYLCLEEGNLSEAIASFDRCVDLLLVNVDFTHL